jgi:ubiquinone biosynthesis protein UbiJ
MVQLCRLVKPLLVNFIHTFQNAVTLLLNQLVQLKSNIKHYLAQFTNQVLLIKAGLINVATKVGQLGQRLVTIAHKIRQHVIQAWRQGN